ncbi:hypothetical protein [Burkholderia ubonensis]|uniref:hypothetical protein n=1 Tax=Burkholderia ubonensis TaxID=101571 RepID=UPI0012F7EC1A|nr:hypothetical protein [Burkholderia ubonensis]
MAIADDLPKILERRWSNLEILKGPRTPAQFRRDLDMSSAFLKFFTKSDARRPIGEQVARQIEVKLGLPALWLDQQHSPDELENRPQGLSPQAMSDTQVSTMAIDLHGLSPLQTALLVTVEKLCRAQKMPDKTVVQLLTSLEGLLE